LGAVAVLLVSLVSVDAAAAASRKARGLYSRGVAAEAAGDFDKALEMYSLASQESPRDSRFTLAERRMRFVAGQAHVSVGLDLRQQGLLEEALTEFEQAFAIDPASSVAAQERRRTIELIEQRDALAGTGEAPPAVQQSALEEARFERAQMVGSITEPADLVPLSTEPINLMLKEQSKVVFETIGKLAGINVLFDPDFSDSEVEIEIRNATLPEALDYVGLLAKAFWKPVTHNTVMVANDNPNKRREFEDEVIKTVYLTNLSTQQDLAEVSTAIRGVTDLRRLFTVASMNALVIRGSRSKVAIAEKIVHDMDKPKPEVVVDVLVLETSKSTKRTLGLAPTSPGGKGLQFPIGYTGAEAGGIALNRFGDVGVGSWSTVLPGFQLTALFSNSQTELLQSPRVRTADNHQADLRIGDRIPIATGSFQPGVGGVGINPLVNTQFTYTDVGVNVSLTPKIHANREVSMHVEVEISNVRDFVDIGGISQPVIGQRTIQHDIRVQEGEASVIGGLNQSQIFTTRAGVPFLGEIPVIGKLFSDEDVQRSESEILLVLIPHIVRMPGIEPSNLRTIASGTDQKFELRYEQEGNGQPALGIEPGDPAAVRPEQTPAPAPAATPQPEPEPAEPQPSEATDQPTPTADTPQPDRADDPDTAEAPSPQGPQLSLEPEMAVIPVDQRVTLSLVVGDAVELASMPLRIQYDREKLRLVGIERGPFLAGDDASDIIFSRSIRHANGLAAVNISRFPGAGGADGDGVLVTLTFEGLASGTAQLRVTANAPRDASNRTLDVQPLEAEISVE
jgi:general secretion pathway protein D